MKSRFSRLLLPLCCLASIACLSLVALAEPPRNPVPAPVVDRSPHQTPPSPVQPRVEPSSTIKENYRGPKVLVIVQGLPKVKPGQRLKTADQLPPEAKAIAQQLCELRYVEKAAPDGTHWVYDPVALLDGDTLYVGIEDGNRAAKEGAKIARFGFLNNCSNNSMFEADSPALTKAAWGRIENALVAWTVSRHTVPDATLLKLNARSDHFDVQLNFTNTASVSPAHRFMRMFSQR